MCEIVFWILETFYCILLLVLFINIKIICRSGIEQMLAIINSQQKANSHCKVYIPSDLMFPTDAYKS